MATFALDETTKTCQTRCIYYPIRSQNAILYVWRTEYTNAELDVKSTGNDNTIVFLLFTGGP